jgi:hypothetical protein
MLVEMWTVWRNLEDDLISNCCLTGSGRARPPAAKTFLERKVLDSKEL